MTTETIFICFCEDFEENNGIEKPYFMSQNLMKFVENSRKFKSNKEKRYMIPTISKTIDSTGVNVKTV